MSSRQHGDHHHEEKVGVEWSRALVTSPAQPYSGHQKASAREADPRTPGDERVTIRKLAQNRQEWRTFVAAFHASAHCGR